MLTHLHPAARYTESFNMDSSNGSIDNSSITSAQQKQLQPVLPPSSALQNHIEDNVDPSSPHPAHLQHLALQIQHNLQYQHNWTDVRIHDYSILEQNGSDTSNSSANGKRKRSVLPRPLISGLPRQRLYVHPDEQIALLQAAKKKSSKSQASTEGQSEDASTGGDSVLSGLTTLSKLPPEREWILPSHLKEKWTLRQFGEVFDQISLMPPGDKDSDEITRNADVNGGDEKSANPWRTKKRVVLATVDDDSTVMYYIVHEGIVKPRQN